MKRLLLLCCLLFTINCVAQTNLYVDSSVSSSGAGTSWTTAYKTLNEALNLVNAASTTVSYTINLAKGTYYPTGIQTGTNRDSSFYIGRGGVRLYGGYPSGGGTRNTSTNSTILSGNIGAVLNSTDNNYHVMVIGVIGATADTIVIDGLRISDGYANGTGNTLVGTFPLFRNSGGGIQTIYNQSGKFFINNCIFSNDTASGGDGGAMFLSITMLQLTDCTFLNNSAAGRSGGAICGVSVPPTSGNSIINATNTSFTGNVAASGAAISNVRSNPTSVATNETFINCVFSGNIATGPGGAIRDSAVITLAGGSSSFRNCTFSVNAALSGGAVYGVGYGLSFVGCTILSNTAKQQGGGIYGTSNGAVGMDSCFVIGNKANVSGGGVFNSGLGSFQRTTFSLDSASIGGGAFSNGTFTHCAFQSNKGDRGAGLSGGQTIRQSIFSGNFAALHGGAIYNGGGGYPTYEQVLFSGNKAVISGGALYDSLGVQPLITFCTFAGDTALKGNGIYNTNGSSPIIKNCIIWEGPTNSVFDFSSSTSNITYSTVQGGFTGTGNISSNPIFISPIAASLAPATTGNYSLYPCSPAIDAGQYLTAYVSSKDIRDSARYYGSGMDMGAYEISPTFPSPITGGLSLCVNSTIQLGNKVPGGTWASSNTSLATVSSSGLVTGISNGIDTISYSAANGSCSMTVTQILTINALPAISPISGKNNACVGDTIHLGNANPGGSWISYHSTIATVNFSGEVTGISPGIDTIRYTTYHTNGCTNSVIKIITVNTSPVVDTITGPATLCKLNPAQFSNTTPGGTWASSNTAVGTVSSTGVVTGIGAGTTTITYTVSNAACSTIVSRVVTVKSPDVSVSQNGNQLTANQTGASYQWIDCGNSNTPVSGATSRSFTASVSGQYAVIVTFNGCTDTSVCFNVTQSGISTQGNVEANIHIYPNPASDNVIIETGTLAGLRVIIRDMAGKELEQLLPALGNIIINVAGYSSGIYLIEVYYGDEKYTRPMSIIH